MSKIPDLSELTIISNNEELEIVDVSDTTDSAQGTSKRVAQKYLLREQVNSYSDLSEPYDDFGIPNYAHIDAANIGGSADTAYFGMFRVTRTITITAMKCLVIIAGGTTARLGIYKEANEWSTSDKTLVLDAGTVDPSTTGEKLITGLSTVLTPGCYYAVIISNGATNLWYTQGYPLYDLPLIKQNVDSSSSFTVALQKTMSGVVAGGFPSTTTHPSTYDTSGTNELIQRVFMKWTEV